MENKKTEIIIQNEETGLGVFTPNEVKIMQERGIIPQGTPQGHISAFLYTCKEKGLSPFSNEIYLLGYYSKVKNKTLYSVIVGIDGYRKVANRTGLYAGREAAKYNVQPDGSFNTLAQEVEKWKRDRTYRPLTCEVTVYKVVAGLKVAFTLPISFQEFNTGKQKWVSMPFKMIDKCAESQSMRSGFSELGGLHTPEEMGAVIDDQPHTIETYDVTVDVELSDDDNLALEDIEKSLKEFKDKKELYAYYEQNKGWQTKDKFGMAVLELFKARKEEIESDNLDQSNPNEQQ